MVESGDLRPAVTKTQRGSTAHEKNAFDAFMVDHGGRLSVDDDDGLGRVFGQLQAYLDAHLARLRAADETWAVEIGYVANKEFNALAANSEGVDLIAINMGLPLRLMSMFHILLSQRGCFANIGNPDDRNPISGIALESVVTGDYSPPRHVFKSDAPEKNLALDFAYLALDFIVFHECAHITNGHLAWLQGKLGIQTIDELSMAGRPGLSGIDLQTLEYDADASGIHRLLGHVLGEAPRADGENINQTIRPSGYLGTFEEAILKIVFSTYICCKMFETPSDATSIGSILQGSHPPAYFRVNLAVAQIMTVLHHRMDIPLDVAESYTTAGIVEAEQAWSSAFGIAYRPPDVALIVELSNLYKRNWGKLRPELEPFSRFGKLAPDDSHTTWATMQI